MAERVGAGPSQLLGAREELNYDSDVDTKLPMMPGAQPGPDERRKKPGEPQTNMGDPNMNPSPTGQLAWVGFGLGIFSLAALSIAFCSPYWYQTWPNSFNEFRNIGLWEVCMDNYMHYKDDSQEIYSGCWWLFNREKKYWKLREWILPPWLITVQVLVIASLLVTVGTLFTAASAFLHFCPLFHHEFYQSYAMFAASALMFLSSMMTLIGAALYGAMCQDWQWMPRPDWNFLSWGFGFYIIHCVTAAASGACFFMESKQVYDKLQVMEDEMAAMTMQMSAYPPSAYSDYPTTVPPGYNGYSQSAYSQPSYQPSSYAPKSMSQPSYDEKKMDPDEVFASADKSDAPQFDQYGMGVEQEPQYDQYGNPVLPAAPQYDQYGNPVQPAPQYDQYGNPLLPPPQYDQYGNPVAPYYYSS